MRLKTDKDCVIEVNEVYVIEENDNFKICAVGPFQGHEAMENGDPGIVVGIVTNKSLNVKEEITGALLKYDFFDLTTYPNFISARDDSK